MGESGLESEEALEGLKVLSEGILKAANATREYISPKEQQFRNERLDVLKVQAREIGLEKVASFLQAMAEENEAEILDMTNHYQRRLAGLIPQRSEDQVVPQINYEMENLKLQLPEIVRKNGRIYGAIGVVYVWQAEDQAQEESLTDFTSSPN